MKRNLLLLLLSWWATCSAQTDFRFADSTAQWNVIDYSGLYPFPVTTKIYEVNADAIVNGKTYQKIGPFYFRRDSLNRIYTPNYLIYDFGKSANDSISNVGPQNAFCYVDSVDSIMLGHYRKRMFIRYGIDYSQLSFSDVWVDGIGSLYNNPMYGEYVYFIPEQSFDTLLCFFENSQLLYHLLGYVSCDINTGISEIDNPQLAISPNPVSTSLTIMLQQTPTSQTAFQLFDITGRMVLQKPLTETSNQLSVEGLSKGLYLYNVVSEKQKEGSGKLVIE